MPKQHSTILSASVAEVAGRVPRMDGLQLLPGLPGPHRAGPLDAADATEQVARKLSAKMSGLINFGHVYDDKHRDIKECNLLPHLRASRGACAIHMLCYGINVTARTVLA